MIKNVRTRLRNNDKSAVLGNLHYDGALALKCPGCCGVRWSVCGTSAAAIAAVDQCFQDHVKFGQIGGILERRQLTV